MENDGGGVEHQRLVGFDIGIMPPYSIQTMENMWLLKTVPKTTPSMLAGGFFWFSGLIRFSVSSMEGSLDKLL